MIDLYFFEIDTMVVIFAFAIVALLIQLQLCFKARRTWVKMLPIILLAASMIVSAACSTWANEVENLVWFFLVFLSFVLIVACGIGWGLWAIAHK